MTEIPELAEEWGLASLLLAYGLLAVYLVWLRYRLRLPNVDRGEATGTDNAPRTTEPH